MAFERFIELIMPPGKELFDKIIFIPGNHDHHLWETARETQYANYISGLPVKSKLDIPWHTTNMFVESSTNPVTSLFLTKLIQRYDNLKDFQIEVAYPNFGVISGDKRKCVIFHHGHFIEPIYQLMTELANMFFPKRTQPKHIWNVEDENYAWIDFFWSTMGQSGEAGKDVEVIYEKMQDNKALKELLSDFAGSLAKKYDLPGWGDAMEKEIIEVLFNYLVDKFTGTERTKPDTTLSEEAEKGLWKYMNGPLLDQLKDFELKGNMPSDVTFVFGHTHKPFQQDMNFGGYPQWVNVYNTGGWVVESVSPSKLHGGAVVLIDEDYNTISLRMYNEEVESGKYSVRVEEATHAGETNSVLYTDINSLIKERPEPWDKFSQVVARGVYVRAQNLRARINEKAP
jgi:hypothetical protein